LTYSEKAKLIMIYPTYGFANQANFSSKVDIMGRNMREMAYFDSGNWTQRRGLNEIMETWA
jgi:hypothetical protein